MFDSNSDLVFNTPHRAKHKTESDYDTNFRVQSDSLNMWSVSKVGCWIWECSIHFGLDDCKGCRSAENWQIWKI